MSIQFLKSSPGREDIGATLILSFAITTRIIQVNEDDSLVPFLILSSGIGLLLSFTWTGLTILIFKTLDKIKNFTNIGGYYYAWTSEHWKIYRIKLVSYSRYIIASFILLIKQKQLVTPFIYEWSSLAEFENRIRQILWVFTVIVVLLLIWELNSLKRRMDIMRINGAVEDGFQLNALMVQDRWEDVYPRIEKLRKDSIDGFVRTFKVPFDEIYKLQPFYIQNSDEKIPFGDFKLQMKDMISRLQYQIAGVNNFIDWSKSSGIRAMNPNIGNGKAQIEEIANLMREICKYTYKELYDKANQAKIKQEFDVIKQKIIDFENWGNCLFPYGNPSDIIINYYRNKRQ